MGVARFNIKELVLTKRETVESLKLIPSNYSESSIINFGVDKKNRIFVFHNSAVLLAQIIFQYLHLKKYFAKSSRKELQKWKENLKDFNSRYPIYPQGQVLIETNASEQG